MWKEQLERLGVARDRHEALEQAMFEHPDRSVRVRSDRIGRVDSLASESVPWYSLGRWWNAESRPSQTPNYIAGDYYIQDAGSLLALAVLDAKPHEVICDLCAAPGGKATGVLERLGVGGFLVANEPIRSRVDILEWALSRVGNARYGVANRDPEWLALNYPQFFDAILVDAPCSGQTLLGKGKRNENAFHETQILHSAARQRRILESAIQMLKPGGRLVYSTCTFAIEENESQIAWLKSQNPGCWKPIEIPALSQWRSPLEEGCYRLWPDRDRCAGSFAAGLELVVGLDEQIVAPEGMSASGWRERKHDETRKRVRRDRLDLPSLLQGFGEIQGLSIQEQGDCLCALDEDLKFVFDLPSLRLPRIGEVTGKVVLPTHGLAMLHGDEFKAMRTFALSENQVMQFGKGESLALEVPAEGWGVATWDDRPLGWLKAIRQRANNYLPKLARIN